MYAIRSYYVTVAGDVYSEGLSEGFMKAFASGGGTVLTQLRYLQDATDFAAEVRVIGIAKADLVFVPGYTRDVGMLLRQARGQGLTMPFLGGDGWSTLERYPFLDPAKGDNYYVVITSYSIHYTKLYESPPSSLSYRRVQILLHSGYRNNFV